MTGMSYRIFQILFFKGMTIYIIFLNKFLLNACYMKMYFYAFDQRDDELEIYKDLIPSLRNVPFNYAVQSWLCVYVFVVCVYVEDMLLCGKCVVFICVFE